MSNIKQIQSWLKKNNIDVFIIPRTDEFLSEYIAPYAERLNWISNFSGSAGKAIVMHKAAAIFIDGRYTVQAQTQIDKKKFQIEHLKNFHKWLQNNLQKNFIIGLDAHLHSKKEVEEIRKISNSIGANIKFLDSNPIDLLWYNQPARPRSKAFIHELQYCGISIDQKISQIRTILKKNHCDYYILNQLDSIAWLLNLRGNDLAYTPINLAYVIITPINKIELFIDNFKINHLKNELTPYINCHSFGRIRFFIESLSSHKNIGMDKIRTPIFFEKICTEKSLLIKYLEDPCLYPKAQKNNIELQGARNANIRDGVSVTKFLYWLKNEIIVEKIDEFKASHKLMCIRKNNDLFYSLSFDTISAIGEHAALPHYNVDKNSNLTFKKDLIYLIDSGAQYLDCTTDITRTVILGKPTNEQKDRFTRVLKGHIAIATSIFKKGTKGSSLDPIARKSLKEIKCDYDHGTGHGIGSFLSVHEGPQRISKSQGLNDSIIMENMILSNEPGFYKKGQYGIRIENLIIVKKGAKDNLYFETISWAPLDINLIETTLLTSKELAWINNYHQKVFNKLKDKLKDAEKYWLQKATAPISK